MRIHALVRILGFNSKEEMQAVQFPRYLRGPRRARCHCSRNRSERVHSRSRDRHAPQGRKQIHCLTSGLAMRDASGRPVCLQGTLIDITERREMEKRLQRNRALSRRMVAGFPDLVAVLDRDGAVHLYQRPCRAGSGLEARQTMWGACLALGRTRRTRTKLHAMFQRIVEWRGKPKGRSSSGRPMRMALSGTCC